MVEDQDIKVVCVMVHGGDKCTFCEVDMVCHDTDGKQHPLKYKREGDYCVEVIDETL